MTDLISRQAAIDALERGAWGKEWDKTLAKAMIESVPSAQPERKKGFWYALEKGDKGYSAGDFKCSVCGEPNRCYVPKPHFCPSCGADMRGENDEAD